MSAPLIVSRRSVLAGTGALVLSFASSSLFAQDTPPSATPNPEPAPAPPAPPPPPPAKLPGSLDKTRMLDAWIKIDAQDGVTVFTGKAELGQGIKTAILRSSAGFSLDCGCASTWMSVSETSSP